jgi:hypothetical protein
MRHLRLLLLLLSPALHSAPIDVAVSILPQKFFVQSIGGGHVAVQVMVGPRGGAGCLRPDAAASDQARLHPLLLRHRRAVRSVWVAAFQER